MHWRLPPSYTQLEVFAEQVYGTLLKQLLHILTIKDENAQIVASHLGRSLGLVEAIKQTRINALNQQTSFAMLPADLCARVSEDFKTLTII